MSGIRWWPFFLVVLLGGLFPCSARAAERVAILVMGAEPSYDELADQCTEVLVAAVSRREDAEIVGKEEFLARLSLRNRRQVEQCLQEKTCLARAETVLGLATMIFGYLGGEKDTYRLHLLRVSAEGEVDSQVKREFAGGTEGLLSGIAPLLDQLYLVEEASMKVKSSPPGAQVYLDDRPVGTTPLLLPRVAVGTHKLRLEAAGYETHSQAVQVEEVALEVKVALKKKVSRVPPAHKKKDDKAGPSMGAPGLLFWSLGAASLLSLGSGGVLHGIAYQDAEEYGSTADPSKADDIKRRGERRWTAALVCYGAGLLLAASSAVVYWLETESAKAGGGSGGDAHPGPGLGVIVTPSGGMVIWQGAF